MLGSADLDLVRLSASELQSLLRNDQLTSVDLVKQSLAQIEKHNHQGLSLRAVISTCPRNIALDLARKLDQERAQGKLRGPFHGIPILVKDAIITRSDLARATKSAVIIDKLEMEGMIVLAKTNLNELASWKAMGSTNGWSAVGGQTNSPYVEGGTRLDDGVMGHTNPCGASTGSAVGVAAGFAPIAIGTEVDGSLVQPAARAALYALKPTIGNTELQGIYAVSEDFDSLGAMAKSTQDLALLTSVLLKPQVRAHLPSDGYLSYLGKSFRDLRVGFVDPTSWQWPANVQPQYNNSLEEMQNTYLNLIDVVKTHDGHAIYPIALPPASELMIDGQPATIMAIRHVFKTNVDAFLGLFDHSEVRTVEELIQFNKDHADKELPIEHPEQGRLIDTVENPINKVMYDKAINLCRTVGGKAGIDKALSENELDLLLLPMDSPSPRLAAAAGYPIATVPLGTITYNNRPFGLAIIATREREDLLFRFMSAFEAVSGKRPVPSMLAV